MSPLHFDKLPQRSDNFSEGFISMFSFGEFDRRGLHFFGLGLMLIVIFQFGQRMLLIGPLFGPDGIFPAEMMEDLCFKIAGPDCAIRNSLFSIFSSRLSQTLILGIGILCAFAIAVGLRSILFFWIILFIDMSFKMRYFGSLHGGDFQLTWVLLWASFLPWQASPQRKWAGPLFFIYVIAFYFYLGAAKKGTPWSTGGAVSITLLYDFMLKPGFDWLLDLPRLTKFLTFSTKFLEMFGAFTLLIPLRFQRIRLVVCTVFIIFHIMLALVLSTTPLGQLGVLTWLFLMPPLFWDWVYRIPVFPWTLAKINFVSSSLKKYFLEVPEKVLLALASSLMTIFLIMSAVSIHIVDKNSVPGGTLYSTFKAWGLSPFWNFFEMRIPMKTGWIIVRAKDSSGEEKEVDLVNQSLKSPVSYQKPALQTSYYGNRIWSKSLSSMVTIYKQMGPRMLATSACRRFRELTEVEVLFFEQEMPEHVKTLPPAKEINFGTTICEEVRSPLKETL